MTNSLLASRVLVPEEMDDPALPTEELQGALAGLSRLNRISNSARIVWPAIRGLARRQAARSVRVLDIATGAGDIPLALFRRGQRSGIKLEITGIDLSERSIEFARLRAEQAGAPIYFHCCDALAGDLPGGHDVVMCSLFLHHLPTASAVELLRRMAAAAEQLVLVSDLRRSFYGLVLAFAASRLFSRSQVVHVDAVRSARAAFTPQEFSRLAQEAGLVHYEINAKWPARMLLKAAGACKHSFPRPRASA